MQHIHPSSGVEEESAEFRHEIDLASPSRFRSIAGVGPVYEIMSIGETTVRIRMIDEDAELDYPRLDAELDPLA